MSARLRAFLWVNFCCLCWAGNIAVGRGFRDAIAPSLLVALRSVIAAALLWLLVRAAAARAATVPVRSAAPLRGRARLASWGLLLLMSATGFVGYQGLLYQGLHTTTALNASLINALCPLMTALMAWAFLGTTIGWRACGGIVLSIAGVTVIVSGGEFGRLAALEFRPGDLLMLLAVLLWGAYALIARRVMQQRPVLAATALATTIAIPLSFAWATAVDSWQAVTWSGSVVAAIVYAAIASSVLGMLAWNRAVQLAGPAQAAAALNMLPLYVLLVSATLLHEPLQLYQLVGGAVVVAGCLLGTLSPSNPAPALRRSASGGAP